MKFERPQFDGYKKTELDEQAISLEKGRLIKGVDSHPVILRPLTPEEYRVEWKNEDITSDVAGVNAEDFVYMIDNTKNIGVAVMGEAPHWRNVATPGDTTYTDSTGVKHHFFEIATKGIGVVKSEVIKDYDYETLAIWNEYDNQINLGHSWQADYNMFEGDLVEFNKKLIGMGIRSEMYWVIAKVDKVSFEGKLMDVKNAREKGVIHKNKQLHPYVGVRVLRTNHRIEEFTESDISRQDDILTQVIDNFNKETMFTGREMSVLDKDNKADLEKYYFVVTEQHIKNLAKLISNGFTYYHMHSSNLTMMGEIVDTGVIEGIYSRNKFKNEEDIKRTEVFNGVRVGYIKDMRDCILGLRKLLTGLTHKDVSIDRNKVCENALATFKLEFDDVVSIKSDKKASPEIIKKCFEEILKRMIVGRETLPALKHNSLSSWNLKALDTKS